MIYNPFVNPVHGGLSTKIRKDIPHKKHKKHWISFSGTRSLFGTTPETAVSVETQTKLRFFSRNMAKASEDCKYALARLQVELEKERGMK